MQLKQFITYSHDILRMTVRLRSALMSIPLLIFALACFFTREVNAAPSATSNASAEATLSKCVSKLKSAKGVSASFTIVRSGDAGSASGTLKCTGKKFAIVASAAGAWYDGKTLYTWSKQSGEVTLSTPTASELRDTNPLLYLESAADYSAAFGKSANASQKVVILTPKKRGAAAKKVTVTLNAASLIPAKLDVVTSDGHTLKVTLKNVSLNSSIPASTFVFPSKKYPGVKRVDLR